MDTQQPSPQEQQRHINLSEFMPLALTDFVDHAYRTVLGREADPVSRTHYITALCTGMLSRAEILDALNRSPEGSPRGVVISGLQSRLRFQRVLFGIPLLGRLLRLAHRLRSLSPLLRMVVDMVQQQALAGQQQQALADQQQQALADQQQQIQGLAERHHRAEVRLGLLEAGVNSIRLETRRAIAEYRRYLLALEPSSLVAERYRPEVSPQAASCSFGNSIYASFEDEFRGTPEKVRQGLSPYLPLVRETVLRHPGLPVIDLGCGRGEWLELLTDERMQVKGADLNPAVVAPLVAQGFDVAQSEVFAYLAGLPDASAAVVTSFHLIEHLPPEQWIPLLDQIRRILAPGGLAIIETPNPRNILVGSGEFYRDPSHHTPVFPDTLSFFGRVRGFDDSMAWYFVDDRSRLIPADSWRFDSLDDYVRISRDYAWMGRKSI